MREAIQASVLVLTDGVRSNERMVKVRATPKDMKDYDIVVENGVTIKNRFGSLDYIAPQPDFTEPLKIDQEEEIVIERIRSAGLAGLDVEPAETVPFVSVSCDGTITLEDVDQDNFIVLSVEDAVTLRGKLQWAIDAQWVRNGDD